MQVCVAVLLMQYIHTLYCFTQDGYNALYIAVQKRHEDIVELLCEAIADPELKEKVVHFMIEKWMHYAVHQATGIQ